MWFNTLPSPTFPSDSAIQGGRCFPECPPPQCPLVGGCVPGNQLVTGQYFTSLPTHSALPSPRGSSLHSVIHGYAQGAKLVALLPPVFLGKVSLSQLSSQNAPTYLPDHLFQSQGPCPLGSLLTVSLAIFFLLNPKAKPACHLIVTLL